MLLRFLVYGGLNWFMTAVYVAIYGAAYSLLSSRAQPVMGSDGQPRDVANIKTEYFCQYSFDVLYVTAAVQLLSLITKWAYLLFAIVPIYAVYKLVGTWAKFQSAKNTMGAGADEPKKEKRPKMRIMRR